MTATVCPRSAPIVYIGLLALVGCDREAPRSLPGPEPEGCAAAADYDVEAMTADLAYLASPELDGRAPGSQGDGAARAFVAERFACLGLEPLGDGGGYPQAFSDFDGYETANVLAMIGGQGTGVSEESIIVSAHLDHFGGGWLGANDNASGVTALLAIAAALARSGQAPDRTLVFAVFGAEESGFEGAEHFVRNPPRALDIDRVVYNLNMDMVGSYAESGALYALGTFGNTPGRRAVADRARAHPSIEVALGDGSDQSDNAVFCADGVPYIFLWTEDGECYHERCDTSSRIDYASLAEIAALAGEVTLDLANSGDDLAGGVLPGTYNCF